MRAFSGVLMAGLALVGCGGSDDSAHDRVERFVRQANAVQGDNTPAFNRANRAYLSFSKGKLPPARASRELERAERSMRATRDRLAELDAPVEARELQRRLVALFDADAALAHESTLLAGFVPAQAKASRPLERVGTRLSQTLRGARAPAAQQRALRTYAAGVEDVLADLEPLKPPPILLARHSRQLDRLRTVRVLALRLAGALKAQDSRKVASLLRRFRKVNATPGETALSPAAVRAYNRRYLAVRRKLQQVQVERKRLQERLG